MDLLTKLIIAMVPIVPILFWLWMFRDMTNHDHLPQCFITFTRGNDSKFDWMVAFIFLSVFTAIIYYVNVYRNRY
jgi:hypothetical protein